jgi:beta-phosphoglucomutase-like phosphatase (HAD superfamily)
MIAGSARYDRDTTCIGHRRKETFPIAEQRFDALTLFRGIVVSTSERLVKPDQAIYRLLVKRYGLDPARCIYVDDNATNADTATSLGTRSIHFTDPDALADEPVSWGSRSEPAERHAQGYRAIALRVHTISGEIAACPCGNREPERSRRSVLLFAMNW